MLTLSDVLRKKENALKKFIANSKAVMNIKAKSDVRNLVQASYYRQKIKACKKTIALIKNFNLTNLRKVKPRFHNPYEGSITIHPDDYRRIIILNALIAQSGFTPAHSERLLTNHLKHFDLDRKECNPDFYIYGEHLGTRFSNEGSDYASVHNWGLPFQDIYDNLV